MTATERFNILFVSEAPEVADRVNTSVRASGVSIKVTHAASTREAKAVVKETAVDLIACEAGGSDADYGEIVALNEGLDAPIPIVAVAFRPGNSDPVSVLESGLSALAYVDLPGHLALVISREITIARALRRSSVLSVAAESARVELSRVFESTGDAMAITESGILVRVNAAWQDLFGQERSAEGSSVMELFDAANTDALKKALRRHEDTALDVVALTGKDSDIQARLAMRRIVGGHGEPMLELTVMNRGGRSSLLAELQLSRQLDTETGLPDRGSLLKRLGKAQAASLLVIRIDNFSKVIDRIGMAGGDTALRRVASILGEQLPDGGYAARIESTSFGVLLTDDDHEVIEQWGKDLCQVVSKEMFEHAGRSTTMSVSIGIRHDVANREAPVDEAWMAVRDARKAGGGRIEVHVDAEEKSQAERQAQDAEWATRIKTAIRKDRFRMAFQQVAGLDGERSDIFDVLLRMQDESGNDILPGEFLPSASRTGLTVVIDRWVIANALKQLQGDGSPGSGSTLFVRLSDESIADDTFVGWLKKQLGGGAAGKTGKLTIGLSERQVDGHLKQVRELSRALGDMGCGMVLTNFGNGDQSAQLLDHLKLDFIKLDAPLIENLKKDEAKRTVVAELIMSAKSRGVLSIASGIEDANTMALLWQLGIGYIQGNYVQEPEVIIAGA